MESIICCAVGIELVVLTKLKTSLKNITSQKEKFYRVVTDENLDNA